MRAFVVACCPARNRGWALPGWFEALRAQTRSPDAAYVLLNDCEDDSAEVLHGQTLASDGWLRYDVLTTGTASGDSRAATPSRPRYSAAHLASLRNTMVETVLCRWPQATHILSVDSDICLESDVLERLLAAELPVVAAVVANGPHAHNFFLGQDAEGPRRCGREREQLAAVESPFPVTMTGAAVLIACKVWDSGVRYGDHSRGEDVAFCQQATAKGFTLHVHPLARTNHFMEKPLD